MSKAWSKDIWVDPHTFGGTKACEVLADMLNQNVVPPYEKHRILSFLNDITQQFKYTAYIPLDSVRVRAMLLLKDDIFRRIDRMTYSPKIKSYLKNIASHHYRKNLEYWGHV